jgi:ABC-2 type transport system permease protein
MPSLIPVILWTQWRTIWNMRLAPALAGRLLGLAMALVWYGLWTGVAAVTAVLLADPARRPVLEAAVHWALLLVLAYWQLTPIVTTSLGASLNVNKLLIFPVPERQLFVVEVLLRLTTGLEMVFLLAGMALGLLWNPAVSGATALVVFPLYALFNLLLAAGLRNLLERVAARKRIRELLVLLVVLGLGVPQLLMLTGVPRFLQRLFSSVSPLVWPWTAAGRLALGHASATAWAVLGVWLVAAYFFGRWQFARSLRWDAAAAASAGRPGSRGAWLEALYRLPGRFFADPLGTIIEKELRSMFRTARFRLVFLMGFTFGFLIWAPLWRVRRGGFLPAPEDLSVLVSVYALLLLSEVAFWNVFGFERSAAQFYFASPAPFWKVLAGKNLAAVMVVLLEIALIAAVSRLVGLRVTAGKILETCAVLLILSLYQTATGNLSSLYWPRPMDPDQPWGRVARGRSQALMVVAFPIASLPVAAAYVARYFSGSSLVFAGVLGLAALIGAACYRLAMRSAVTASERRREIFLAALSQGAGPVAG